MKSGEGIGITPSPAISIVETSNPGRLSQTKYILRNTPERVKITRAHHPLLDQEFEVLKADRHRLVVQHFDGGSMKIPRAWTNADDDQEFAQSSPPRVFTVEALRELLDLTDALRQRD
jgi:hypothetical protein